VVLKIILPVVAGIGLLAIIIWPHIQARLKVDDPATRKLHRIIKSQPFIKNTAMNPEYISNDAKGRPYVIRAKTAVYNDPKVIDLTFPTGEFKLEQDYTVKFSAKRGHYVKLENHLQLNDNVHVATDDGYDLYTKVADLDLKENSAEGDEAVHGTGPMGENILAEGFKVLNKEKDKTKVHFKGKTTIEIPPKEE